MAYQGPLRQEPIAVELHNTLYAVAGERHDGLADEDTAAAFLAAIAPRLGGDQLPPGAWPGTAELVALRTAVRAVLGAAAAGESLGVETVAPLNLAAAAAPTSTRAVLGDGRVALATDYHGAGRATVVLAAFAASAIDLLAGPRRGELSACTAPGCVLIYRRDNPRRRWCCDACGNRARQARHYARARGH